MGRLSDEKGVKTLLKAWQIFEQSEQSNNRTILTFIGDGVQRAEYESLAEGLNVRFVGKLSHDEVLKELSGAKLLVMPSEWWETFGLVVIEAAMCGTPAVVSDLGALPDLVQDGRCGEVFKAGDAHALAGAIRRLLERTDYDEVCKNCREEAETRHSEEANYRQLMDLYSSLVSVG